MVHKSILLICLNLLVLTSAFPQNEETPKNDTKAATTAAPPPPPPSEEGATEENLPTQLSVDIFGEGDCSATTPAAVGDTLAVLYDGKILNTNEEFASKWDPEEPFVFKLGDGKVVEGWEVGLIGMCLGEKRILTIPSDLGYGEEGVPPTIPPHSALQYTIVLLGKE